MEPTIIKKNKIENEGIDEIIILQYNNNQWHIDKEIIQKVPYLQTFTENPSNNEFYILPANEDCNFNENGLDFFFGVLVEDKKMDIKPSKELINLLAVSLFFQCQELCQYSEERMIKSIDETNVIEFLIASQKYSMEKSTKTIIDWLLINFMSSVFESDDCESQLEKMDEVLMMRLLKDKSFIVPDEYRLYTALKTWMLLDLKKKDQQELYENIDKEECFLDTVAGQQYKPFFDLIRLHNLIDYTDKVKLIRHDQIFSNKQINAVAFKTYQIILELKDKNCLRIAPDFEKNCFRSSKLVIRTVSNIFRTDYFNYGVPIRFDFTSKKFSVERLRPENSKHKLFCHNIGVNIRIRLSLHSLTTKNSFEKTPIFETSLPLINEPAKDIYVWRKPIFYPCILFMETQTIILTNSTVKPIK